MSAALRIALCEDDAQDAESLRDCIQQSGYLVWVEWFDSGESLLNSYEKGKYDVVFVDVYLPGMSGIDTVRAIRGVDSRIVVVFVTSSIEHTRDGYRLGALKYIEKPFSSDEVKAALGLAWILRDKQDVCVFATKSGEVRVPLETICYVEITNHTCMIHLESGMVETNMKIERLAALLPPPRFIRCHRSFIVNLEHVQSVDRDFVMTNGDRVYIRGKDLKKMTDAHTQYLFDVTRGCKGDG